MIRVQYPQGIDHVLMVVSLWKWESFINMWQFQGDNETTTEFDAQQLHHSFQQQQTGNQCLQCGYLPKVLDFETLVIFIFIIFKTLTNHDIMLDTLLVLFDNMKSKLQQV